LFTSLKSDLNRREQQLKEANKTLNDIGKNIDSAQRSLDRAGDIIMEIKDS
jgi:chromosome segregation ATPase